MREVLNDLRPLRIGHGVRSVEDAELMTLIRDNDVHLEVCPTSNIQTNVFATIEDHPAAQIYESGISMSINTDSRAISDTTLSREYSLMEHHFNWGIKELLHCNLEAVRHAFAPEALKIKLKETLLYHYIK